MTVGSAKFKGMQKQEAKQVLRECIIARFSVEESLSYMRTKLKREDITDNDYYKLKRNLKGDTQAWMNALMKDRWAYISEYRERVQEYEKYQKEYWRIFFSNPNNGYLQKICLDSLQNATAAITSLYDIMPEIAGAQFVKEPVSKTTEEEATKTTVSPTTTNEWV